MNLIKDLNYIQLKFECENIIKERASYPKALKKVNAIFDKVQNILNKSKNEKTILKKLDELKEIYNEKTLGNMVDVISDHLKHPHPTKTLELKYNNESKKYYLQPGTAGILTSPHLNLSKIFLLKATFPDSTLPIDFIAINPEAYSKFAKFMSENADVTDWFTDFIYEVRNHIEDNEIKLKKYILMLFENLTKEQKVEISEKEEYKDLAEYLRNRVPDKWDIFKPIISKKYDEEINKRKDEVIEEIIDTNKDPVIQKFIEMEMSSPNMTKKKLIENIRRSLYR